MENSKENMHFISGLKGLRVWVCSLGCKITGFNVGDLGFITVEDVLKLSRLFLLVT